MTTTTRKRDVKITMLERRTTTVMAAASAAGFLGYVWWGDWYWIVTGVIAIIAVFGGGLALLAEVREGDRPAAVTFLIADLLMFGGLTAGLWMESWRIGVTGAILAVVALFVVFGMNRGEQSHR